MFLFFFILKNKKFSRWFSSAWEVLCQTCLFNGFSSHFWRKKNLILRYWELFNKRLLHLGIEKGAPFIWKCIHVSFKYTSVDVRPTLTDSFRQEAEKNSPDRQRKEKEKKNWTWRPWTTQSNNSKKHSCGPVKSLPVQTNYGTRLSKSDFDPTDLHLRFCYVQTKANLCHEVVWFIIFSFV